MFLHITRKKAYRATAVLLALVMSFQDCAVFADEISTAVGVAAADKEAREKEQKEKEDREALYDKYFGKKRPNSLSENSGLFDINEHNEIFINDTYAGESISGNGCDYPAFLRMPQSFDDEENIPRDAELIDVGRYYKTFLLSNGKYRTIATTYPNTYDDKGIERDIDNTIIPSDETVSINGLSDEADSYTNTANAVDVIISGDDTAGAIELKKKDDAITLLMENGDYSKKSVSDNAIRYNEVFENTDVQYTITNLGVKEDIILLNENDIETYDYKLDKDGIIAKEENGNIIICTDDSKVGSVSDNSISSNTISENSLAEGSVSDNDIPFAVITAPLMKDAVGAKSTDITLKLKEGDDHYIIELIPDKTWLNDTDRVYPVMIDPTVTIQSQITTYTVTQAGIMYHGGASNYVGSSAAGVARTYMITSYLYQSIWDVAGTNEVEVTDATLRLYQTNDASDSNICIYRLVDEFTHGYANWDNTVGLERIAAGAGSVKQSGLGYHEFDITDTVNGWSTGNYESYGLEIMLDNESKAAVELAGEGCGDTSLMPLITFDWEKAGDVSSNYNLNDTTINIRPIVKSSVNGELQCYGVFADGLATPDSALAFALNDSSKNYLSAVVPGKNKIYPDTTSFENDFPIGTLKYRNKLSNWQTQYPFTSYDLNKLYYVEAQAAKSGSVGKKVKSDEFLIYKITRFDTLKKIADYYGVKLDQILFDNKAADMLLVENNTVFIRNPKRNTDKPYEPSDLTDDDKAWIDRLLLGRAKHCEYGFEPVNLNTGNFYLSQEDLSYSDSYGEFKIYRNYNSLDADRMGSFGRGFVSLFDEGLSFDAARNIYYNREDGSEILFRKVLDGVYESPAGEDVSLKRIQVGSTTVELSGGEAQIPIYKYEVTREDESVITFDGTGTLIEIKEKNGAVISITHYKDGRVTGIVREGITFPVSLNSFGCVSKITQPDGGEWNYGYDTNGNLVSVTDPEGGIKRFGYDAKHRMISWNDENNKRIVYNTYDNKGRVIKQIDQGGGENTLSYDEANKKTVTCDAKGDITTYSHDESGRTIRIEYPDNTVEVKSYENGYLKSEMGRDNVLITYERDAKGRITKKTVKGDVKDETGSVLKCVERISTYEYDTRGNLIKTVDPDGNISTGICNASDLPIRATDSDGKATSYTYDARGRILTQTDNDGLITSFTYEGNKLRSKKIGETIVATYAYNANADLIKETDASGNFVSHTYDKLHRSKSNTSKAGRTTAYTYKKNGLLESITDGNGNTITYDYDDYYNISKVKKADGSAVSYLYDVNGDLLKITDAMGGEISYEYDKAHHPVKEINALSYEKIYSYDTSGNVIKIEDEDGVLYRAVYDPTIDKPVREYDANGIKTVYEYNCYGEETKVNRGGVNEIEYKIDASGNIIKETYANGLIMDYTFDGRGNVIKINDSNGRERSYEYNIYNEVTKEISPSGRITSYTYDAAGLATSKTNGNKNKSLITCDKDGNIVTVTDANGNTTEYTYDGNGNITSETNADGRKILYAYDENNNLLAYADALGYVTKYEYDKNGNRIKETDALNNSITYELNGLSDIVKITDKAGAETKIAYDKRGNMTGVIDPYGNERSFTYDLNGNLLSETDKRCNKTSYEYDAFNRVIKKTDALSGVERYEYDIAGNITKKTDSLNNTSLFEYDKYGNLISETDPLNSRTVLTVNSEDEITCISDPNGNKTYLTYDDNGNLIKTVDALGNEYKNAYDGADNLISETNALGYSVLYEYDSVYNLIAVTEKDKSKTYLKYDDNGNIIKTTDAKGNETSFEYDALNRVVSTTDALGNKEMYSYDEKGNLLAEEKDGALYRYEYDGNGNRIKETDPLNHSTAYTYDKNNLVISTVYADNSIERYEYDSLNRMVKKTDPEGVRSSYTYDKTGRLNKVTNGGVTTSYGYDKAGRLSFTEDGNNNRSTYEYDKNGNLIKERDALGNSTFYSYDKLSRLISKTYPNGGKESFSYDKAGRLVSTTSLSDLKTTYTYDEMDRVIRKTEVDLKKGTAYAHTQDYSYDENGNLVNRTDAEKNVFTYSYDKLNRVIDIKTPLSHETSVEYGKLDNVSKVTDAEGIERSYDYDDKGRLLNEYVGDKKIKTYTYDLTDKVRSVKSGNSEITYTYLKNDSLKKVKNPLSNEDEYSYDSFGRHVSKTDALKKSISYKYDDAGNIVTETKENGDVINYSYDKLSRVISLESNDTSVNSSYEYDSMGNLIMMKDVTGTSKFSYDVAGRLIRETSGSNESISYSYDAFGNVTDMIYPDGKHVSYEYDKNNNLIKVKESDKSTEYTYDGEGNVILVTRKDDAGNVTGKTGVFYNKDNRVTKLINTDGSKVISDYSYLYDEFSNITGENIVILSGGKNTNIKNTYEYDINRQLIKSISEKDGKITASEYTYDLAGNRKEVKVNDGENEKKILYSYDEAGALIKEDTYLNGNLVEDDNKEYTYDAKGRLTAVSKKGTVMMAALYDGLDNRIFTLEYDPVNVDFYNTKDKKTAIRKRRSGKASDDEGLSDNDIALEATPENAVSNEPDDTAHVTDQDEDEDEDKEISPVRAFIYGALSELISFLPISTPEKIYLNRNFSLYKESDSSNIDTQNKNNKDGMIPDEDPKDMTENNGISGNDISDDTPDDDNERIIDPYFVMKKEVQNKTGVSITLDDYRKTEYINDINRQNEEVLFEKVSGAKENGSYSYVYGINRESFTYKDESLISAGASFDNSDPAFTLTGTYYYTGTGSVSNLISSNKEGSISYIYGDYGETEKYGTYSELNPYAKEYNNPFTYNGEYMHEELGLQYLRARYYDVKNGCFTSKDTYAGDLTDILSQNRYTYANNNPLSFCDPSGHKSGNNSSNTKTCTAAEQARENALKANAQRSNSSSATKASPSNAMPGVPSDVRKILEKRNNKNEKAKNNSSGKVKKLDTNLLVELFPNGYGNELIRKQCMAYEYIKDDVQAALLQKTLNSHSVSNGKGQNYICIFPLSAGAGSLEMNSYIFNASMPSSHIQINENEMSKLIEAKEELIREIERINNTRDKLNSGIFYAKTGVVATCLIGANVEVGYAFDRNGNSDYMTSVAFPDYNNTVVVGTPNIGKYVSVGYINDKTIYDLEGISESAGGSVDKFGVDLLGDYLTGKINGLQVSYGKSKNLGFEVHIVRSYSKLLNDWE